MTSWQLLTPVALDVLTDARLQLHHAAQIVGAVGISYLPSASDDSHTGFTWRSSEGLMLGEGPLPDRRFALRPADLSLLLTDVTEGEISVFALDGHTVEDAYAWVRERMTELGFDPARLTNRKHYEIPHHTVADGAPFQRSAPEAFDALAAWYRAGWRVAAGARRADEESDGVRIWPHHFDIARLNQHGDGTIGVGMTPGDQWYPAPYLYVGPNPPPTYDELPALPSGQWHTQTWFGAVLPADEMWRWTDATEQETGALAFVNEAYDACEALMDKGDWMADE